MTRRQMISAALSADGASEIPVVLCYEGIFVRDHWRQLTNAPWWHAQSLDINQQTRWRRDVVSRVGQDWFELPCFTSRHDREQYITVERADGVYRRNIHSRLEEQLLEPSVGGWPGRSELASVKPDRLACTREEVDELVALAPAFDSRLATTSGRDDLAKALLQQVGREYYPLGYVAAPLWSTYQLWGFEGMMQMIATQPDLVHYTCERLMARCLYTIKEAAWLGAAGIWIEDCMTDMVSPAAFSSLNIPYLRRIIDGIRQLGMVSIYYYCGNPAGKWDLILASGADALALEESKKGFVVDIEEVVERVNGRCSLLGNLDSIGVLQDGNEDQLRNEIARQIRAGRRNGSRYIMSIGSPVTPGTPVERVRLYCDMAHELGRALAR